MVASFLGCLIPSRPLYSVNIVDIRSQSAQILHSLDTPCQGFPALFTYCCGVHGQQCRPRNWSRKRVAQPWNAAIKLPPLFASMQQPLANSVCLADLALELLDTAVMAFAAAAMMPTVGVCGSCKSTVSGLSRSMQSLSLSRPARPNQTRLSRQPLIIEGACPFRLGTAAG